MMNNKFLIVLVAVTLGLAGCATMIPGLSSSTIRAKDIYGSPRHVVLGLHIEGREKSFHVHRTGSSYEFVQYTSQLQRGFAVPPVTDIEIFPHGMLTRALRTGTAIGFDRVIPMKDHTSIPPEADYVILVELTKADGGQNGYSGYCSIGYQVQLLNREGRVCADTSGETRGKSYLAGMEDQFVAVQEACGSACKQAALEIINWTRARVDKQ